MFWDAQGSLADFPFTPESSVSSSTAAVALGVSILAGNTGMTLALFTTVSRAFAVSSLMPLSHLPGRNSLV